MSELEGVLEIGKTRIPYRVRTSSRAKRMRIVVEPGEVVVVMPEGGAIAKAHEFVQAKRRWVFYKTAKLGDVAPSEPSYLSGSKLRFRGRWLTIEVAPGTSETGSVSYQSRFYVTLPAGVAKSDRVEVTKQLLEQWMKDKLEEDGRRLIRRYATRLGVEVAGVAVVPMKRMWASCGKDAVIRLNAQLMELPKAVLEYVVAHEVCHRLHRNHGPAFWRTVGGVMPDWQDREAWLHRYERDWTL